MHQQLVWFGVPRGILLTAALLVPVGMLMGSLVTGILLGVMTYGLGFAAVVYDPQLWRIVWTAGRVRPRYDPAKHERVDMEFL